MLFAVVGSGSDPIPRLTWPHDLVPPRPRETREGVAPAACWNWGELGLKEYKWKRSFLGWFVGLVVPEQEISVQAWLLSPQYKMFFSTRAQNGFVILCIL